MTFSTSSQLAAIYYAVGLGTEAPGIGSGSSVYDIVPASSAATSGSASSVGVMQTDFGQQSARLTQLVSAYNTYASNGANGVSPISNLRETPINSIPAHEIKFSRFSNRTITIA